MFVQYNTQHDSVGCFGSEPSSNNIYFLLKYYINIMLVFGVAHFLSFMCAPHTESHSQFVGISTTNSRASENSIAVFFLRHA